MGGEPKEPKGPWEGNALEPKGQKGTLGAQRPKGWEPKCPREWEGNPRERKGQGQDYMGGKPQKSPTAKDVGNKNRQTELWSTNKNWENNLSAHWWLNNWQGLNRFRMQGVEVDLGITRFPIILCVTAVLMGIVWICSIASVAVFFVYDVWRELRECIMNLYWGKRQMKTSAVGSKIRLSFFLVCCNVVGEIHTKIEQKICV